MSAAAAAIALAHGNDKVPADKVETAAVVAAQKDKVTTAAKAATVTYFTAAPLVSNVKDNVRFLVKEVVTTHAASTSMGDLMIKSVATLQLVKNSVNSLKIGKLQDQMEHLYEVVYKAS